MGMIFCRGCAKEIHESAPTCPHCGALQGTLHVNQRSQNSSETAKFVMPHWSALTSLITGIIVTLMAISVPGHWDHDTVLGVVLFSCAPIIFGIIALFQKQAGRWMAIAGLALGCVLLLAAIGNM